MEFKLPDLGEGVEEAQVARVLVSIGDEIEEEQGVLEIETEKTTVELPSPAAGTVETIEVSEGDTIKVGQLLAVIGTSGKDGGKTETADKADKTDKADKADKADKTERTEKREKPERGSDRRKDGRDAEVKKKQEKKGKKEEETDESGEDGKAQAEAKETQADKADKEEKRTREEARREDADRDEEEDEARAEEEEEEGEEEEAEDEQRAERKTVEAESDDRDDERDGKAEEKSRKRRQAREPESEPKPRPTTGAVPVFAAPSVRTFAREIGVDIGKVSGSGPSGRISVEDVKRHARWTSSGQDGGRPAGQAPPAPLPDFSQWGEVEHENMSSIRAKTAEHMSLSWMTIPHVTLFENADVTELEASRQRHKDRIEKETGAKLTVTALLLKVTAATLKRFPEVMATADPGKKQIVRKKYCHIGVAVDTPRGLLVPVIRDADEKSVATLSSELDEVARKARDGHLKPADMRGGVFTLTNLGGLGTGYFTPIINHPEGAVLGVGRAARQPVYDEEDERFVPRSLVPLSLSFDHRLIDGADGARFLHWMVQAIADPWLLALEG